MFCRVNVPISSQAGTLVVPSTAILSDGITSRVFVVRNGRSFQQIVRAGVTDGKNTEILGGLADGDLVVTTGSTNARDSGYVSISNK
jgi:multidrug efflux pump subunit AcrA (membrane-fusion protein)